MQRIFLKTWKLELQRYVDMSYIFACISIFIKLKSRQKAMQMALDMEKLNLYWKRNLLEKKTQKLWFLKLIDSPPWKTPMPLSKTNSAMKNVLG